MEQAGRQGDGGGVSAGVGEPKAVGLASSQGWWGEELDEVWGWHRFLASGLFPVFVLSAPLEGPPSDEVAEVAEATEVVEVAEAAEVAEVGKAAGVGEVGFVQEALLEEELVAAEDPGVQADGGHRLGPH